MLEDSINHETMQHIYGILYDQAPDAEEEELLRDPALLPLYIKLIEEKGHPPFPSDLPLDSEIAAEIVRYAVYLVGELAAPDNERAINALIGAIEHDKDRIKVGAATALGKLKAKSATYLVVELLDRMIQKNDLGAIMRLAQALGQIGDERSKARLQQFIVEKQSITDKQTQFVVNEVKKAIKAID